MLSTEDSKNICHQPSLKGDYVLILSGQICYLLKISNIPPPPGKVTIIILIHIGCVHMLSIDEGSSSACNLQ